MAAFDPITCQILLNHGNSYSMAEVAQIPTVAGATMSFSHEYIHFIQSVSSISGFRFLGELIDFGIHGTLVLSGVTSGKGGQVTGYRKFLPLLQALPDGAGSTHVDIRQRAKEIMDEAKALLMEGEYPYSGQKAPWELDRYEITVGTYVEPFWGIVTPQKSFRPITPGMLSEGMARRMDQWIKANHKFNAHSWNGGNVEREYYNGIREVLAQPRYSKNVISATLDRITVIVCSLGLATPRPDESVKVMLDRLAMNITAGGLPDAIAFELKDLLVGANMLHANYFNEVMDGILNGVGRIMDRTEWLDIHEQLKNIHVGGNTVLARPAAFADDTITWNNVRGWMVRHSLPPVLASDGSVLSIDGVDVRPTVTDFLNEVQRVLF
jgi:hypothetical protein